MLLHWFLFCIHSPSGKETLSFLCPWCVVIEFVCHKQMILSKTVKVVVSFENRNNDEMRVFFSRIERINTEEGWADESP